MKSIPLTQGRFALIDDDDFDKVVAYRSWHAVESRGTFYARTNVHCKDGHWTLLPMHRLIMGVSGNLQVDHKNGDGLDNRKENLRVCTQGENAKNRRRSSLSTSPFKGVSFRKRERRWVARVNSNGKRLWLGMYSTAEEAARVYDAKAREVYGAFARTNF